MIVTVNMPDGCETTWTFKHANDIDKLVKALAENVTNWSSMVITITKLGPNLSANQSLI